jgi:hypothetical protein
MTTTAQLGLFLGDSTRCEFCQQIAGHAARCPNESLPPRKAERRYPETDEAVARASKNANEQWLLTAYSVGVMLARRFQKFSAADIDMIMTRDFATITTPDKRAMGGVVRRLMRERYVEKAEWIQDPRPHCHNGPTQVLRSLLFKGGAA